MLTASAAVRERKRARQPLCVELSSLMISLANEESWKPFPLTAASWTETKKNGRNTTRSASGMLCSYCGLSKKGIRQSREGEIKIIAYRGALGPISVHSTFSEFQSFLSSSNVPPLHGFQRQGTNHQKSTLFHTYRMLMPPSQALLDFPNGVSSISTRVMTHFRPRLWKHATS